MIPGNYEYTVATSYGNVGKIAEDASTYFDISCDRFKVVSLDNSYLTIEQDIKITVPTQASYIYSTYYIGYKYAADCIDQYRIYSNTDLVQTQNHARYEWFMMYNSVSDEAKNNSDLYATLDKIVVYDRLLFMSRCSIPTVLPPLHSDALHGSPPLEPIFKK